MNKNITRILMALVVLVSSSSLVASPDGHAGKKLSRSDKCIAAGRYLSKSDCEYKIPPYKVCYKCDGEFGEKKCWDRKRRN